MATSGHIFTSYANEDLEAIRPVVEGLEQHGFLVWASYMHGSIPGGANFHDVITEAIDQSSAFILMWSNQAKDSNWVTGEWTHFLDTHRKRLLIPLRFENLALPVPMKQFQYIDFWDKPREQALSQLLEVLEEYRAIPETVPVANGPFRMGNPVDPFARKPKVADALAESDEDPPCDIDLASFYIGRYAVTIRQFRPFVTSGYHEKRYWTPLGWEWRTRNNIEHPLVWDSPDWDHDDLPVCGISWYEAVAYCNWLSDERKVKYELPSEAEWEKAARSTDGRIWPWGNVWNPQLAHHNGSMPMPMSPSIVNLYSEGQSPYHSIQMAGNVYEWCSSLYAHYPYREDDGREDLMVYGKRVLRGGCWLSDKAHIRCAHRFCALPESRHPTYGFR